ncbi:hypothetical protein DMA11_07260 [Marinilabiliaceae bacterium JC017]|nr:hypothetical protein DMA11_07260 [Marinilabiliaceae bacterium JC017]
MKIFKHFFSSLWVLGLVAVSFSSCNDDDDAEPTLDVRADAVVEKSMIQEANKYAAVFHVFANQVIASAKVTTPVEEALPIDLVKEGTGGTYFVYEPAVEDYLDVMPQAGEYVFEITMASGEMVTLKEEISNKEIDVIVAKKLEFNEDKKLAIEWDEIDGADTYDITIFNEKGDVAKFYSGFLKKDVTSVELGNFTAGWLQGYVPVPGETYKVQLKAYLFEEGTYDPLYNVQCITSDNQYIDWQ